MREMELRMQQEFAAEQQRMQGAIEGETAARKASEAAAKAGTASETNAVVAKLGDVHAASRKASGHLERRIRELEDTLREQKAADLTAIEDLLRSRQATQEQVNSELADRVHRLAELVAQKAGMGQDIEEQWFQELRRAMAEVAGERTELGPMDTSFIPAEMPHRFLNIGEGPLKILWIYAAADVTRTFTETGETVPHLSTGDKV